jgi:hypothetical protein
VPIRCVRSAQARDRLYGRCLGLVAALSQSCRPLLGELAAHRPRLWGPGCLHTPAPDAAVQGAVAAPRSAPWCAISLSMPDGLCGRQPPQQIKISAWRGGGRSDRNPGASWYRPGRNPNPGWAMRDGTLTLGGSGAAWRVEGRGAELGRSRDSSAGRASDDSSARGGQRRAHGGYLPVHQRGCYSARRQAPGGHWARRSGCGPLRATSVCSRAGRGAAAAGRLSPPPEPGPRGPPGLALYLSETTYPHSSTRPGQRPREAFGGCCPAGARGQSGGGGRPIVSRPPPTTNIAERTPAYTPAECSRDGSRGPREYAPPRAPPDLTSRTRQVRV